MTLCATVRVLNNMKFIRNFMRCRVVAVHKKFQRISNPSGDFYLALNNLELDAFQETLRHNAIKLDVAKCLKNA